MAHCNVHEKVNEKQFEQCCIFTDLRFEFQRDTPSIMVRRARNLITQKLQRYMESIGVDPRIDLKPRQTYEVREVENFFSVEDFQFYMDHTLRIHQALQFTVVYCHFYIVKSHVRTRIIVRFQTNQ